MAEEKSATRDPSATAGTNAKKTHANHCTKEEAASMIKNFGEVVDFKEMSTMGEQDGLGDKNMKLHWQLYVTGSIVLNLSVFAICMVIGAYAWPHESAPAALSAEDVPGQALSTNVREYSHPRRAACGLARA